jgi:hypothetical protein
MLLHFLGSAYFISPRLFCQLQLAKDKLFSAQAVLSSLPTLHSGCAPTS